MYIDGDTLFILLLILFTGPFLILMVQIEEENDGQTIAETFI